jgi:hypothetical protein
MALVIFFVPDPAKAVAEMARVTAPGGSIAAYAWDMAGGGFPIAPIHAELQAMGVEWPRPPQADASRLEEMQALWAGAGLVAIETRRITVTRRFADFEEYWSIGCSGPSVRAVMDGLAPDRAAELKARVRARIPADADGGITASATANAVKGRKR